jgi:hypothetical protein
VTAHPGAFCSPEGGTDQTNAGTDMVCSVGAPGQRARWRRNGPAPARRPRKRRAAGSTANTPLPQVNAGIDPTAGPKHEVPEAADAQAAKKAAENGPMTDQEIADRIRKAYGEQPDKWMAMKDLAAKTGLTPEEIARGTKELLKDDNFRAEPEPFGHRVQADDRAVSPVIGGEARHKLAFMDRVNANPAETTPAAPAAKPEPAPAPAPAPAAKPEPAPVQEKRATTMPPRSDQPIEPPNGGWGIDQGLMHFDSAHGRLWNDLGDDQHLTVDGRPLGNVVKDLGEGITLKKHSSQDALGELRRIRQQLPEGSRPARLLDTAIERLDAPARPMPDLPADTPPQLRTLVEELHSIPLVRRGYDYGFPTGEPFHEDEKVAEIARRWSAGELSGNGVGREIERLTSYRHEAMEGWTEIRGSIARATSDVRTWGRRKQV